MTSTNWDYDVIIVGAGVAGSASAILLGQEGHRVLLLDRAVFPRHKTCGEGIMPEGVRVLESLGVLPSTSWTRAPGWPAGSGSAARPGSGPRPTFRPWRASRPTAS